MSRLTKYLSLSVLVLFILACSTVTQPFKDAQNLAGTAQSFATALPVETLKAFATQIPASTLEALPSQMPDFQGMLNPQGTPASDWKGIPIMPQATAGQEFAESNTYSFKADATVTVKEVQDFYNAQLVEQGWSSLFSMPGDSNVSIIAFQKDSNVLNITITNVNGSVVVVLAIL